MPADPSVGLTSADVASLRARYGRNTLPEPRRRTFVAALLGQFRDVMVILLMIAGTIAAVVGEKADLAAIAAIVVLNAVLGAVQEQRAERARASLRALAAPTARVRRDGQTSTVPAAELVPGDIVLLEAGNLVPADLELVEAAQLQAAEAALTGESQPVHKATAASIGADVDGDVQRTAAFHGTCVTHGRGVGVVVATGIHTRLGHIATLLREETQPRTPLQQRLDHLGRRLSLLAVLLCAVILVAGLMRGEPLGLMLMTALSIAVAAIPEALPAVVTIALAIGARRMARHNALIQRLPAVETLGSVTYICVDKTGTLTENRMRVESVVTDDTGTDVRERETAMSPSLLEAMAISNDAYVSPDGEITGDPTEVAFCRFAADAGFMKPAVASQLERVAELTFSPERARMTTLHRRAGTRGEIVAFTKGAPEQILPICERWITDAASTPFDRAAIARMASDLAAAGLRVLAFATATLPALSRDLDDCERHQALLGLVGLLDPPRAQAHDAVALCQRAGIRIVMITGDHAETALTIARRLGIATEHESVLAGSELHSLTDAALEGRVKDTRVYARVSPEDKLRIVKALQAQGEFVAMTGDGVNDAPALQRANIGIAMGQSGTDVARDAAAMVLLDDNFATIVGAVREGRRIYDNIRKFVRYVLTCNLGEILTLLLAPVLGLPLPLLPIQILWVNLVTDGLPGLALTSERADRDIMERQPRPPTESVLAHGMWQHILWVGALIGGLTLATETLALRAGLAHWRSMTFTVLTFTQMAHVLAIRSERDSIFRIGFFSNPGLIGAVALTIVLQFAILYIPALQATFRTQPLSIAELSLVVAASVTVLIGVEFEKLIRRRRALPARKP